jgi:hypothetical protein
LTLSWTRQPVGCANFRVLADAGERSRPLRSLSSLMTTTSGRPHLAGIAQDLTTAEHMEQAVAIAQALKAPWARASALAGLVKVLAGRAQMDDAFTLARTMRIDSVRASALTDVTRRLADAGEVDRAVDAAEQAL